MKSSSDFEPKILVFVCNWCSYAAADLAGTRRIQYSPNIRVIKVMCSGRIDPRFILEAFRLGIDGVLLTGCRPGECHYINGNLEAEEKVKYLKRFLREIGFQPERLRIEWIAASEAEKFAQVCEEMIHCIKQLGPNPIKDLE